MGCSKEGPTRPSKPVPPVPVVPVMDWAYDISSDGSFLVYRHRASVEGIRGVYSLGLSDSARPILLMADSASYLATDCRISPDGMQIVYLKGFQDLYVMNLTARTHTQLTFTLGNANGPDWDPTGHYIVYQRPLIPSGSPDSSAGLRILNVQTLEDYSLRHDGQPTFGTNPRWSPDGTKIAFERHVPWNGVSGSPSRYHIFTVSLVDGTYMDVTPNDKWDNEVPTWYSASRILFESYRYETNEHETRSVSIGGRSPVAWPVDLAPFVPPITASPATSEFVYSGPDSSGKYGVLFLRSMTDISGTTIRQLTTFSPDSASAHSRLVP